jgi:iron complex transport system substrate-binding protein
LLGRIIDRQKESVKLVISYKKRLDKIKEESAKLRYHPKVYFEEWYNPSISGISWVSELIEIAGGVDIFKELQGRKSAQERVVDQQEVIRRIPDIIIGSWCGKKFKKNEVIKRIGWEEINAVKNNNLFEINSTIILQPGPAALTDGLDELREIIRNYKQNNFMLG